MLLPNSGAIATSMLLAGSSLCSYLRTIIVPRSLSCSVSAENSNSPEFCEMFIALPSNTNVFRLEWLAVWSLYQRPSLKSSVEPFSFANCTAKVPTPYERRSPGSQGHLAGELAESVVMGLSLNACVCLLTRASRMKARSASTVKMIA